MTTIFASDAHSTGQPWVNKVAQMRQKYPDATMVFGGDYIDGCGKLHPQEVLDYITDSLLNDAQHCVALWGNHELLAHDFINGQDEFRIWLQNGGKRTVKALYGRGFGVHTIPMAMKQLKVGSQQQWTFPEFLQHLQPFVLNDDGLFVHAWVPLFKMFNPQEQHRLYDLVWARDICFWSDDEATEFMANHCGHPLIVGHTPTVLLKNAKSQYRKWHYYNNEDCPIVESRALECEPIFACDGGAKFGVASGHTGTVAVFDRGHLIDFLD